MYDATHAVKYHATHLAEAREALVSIADRIQEEAELNNELHILMNDVVIQIQVHTQLLEQAAEYLDEPKPAPFWKKFFRK